MQIRAEPKKSALPICNYSQILYQFLTFTQRLKRSHFVFLSIRLIVISGFCILFYSFTHKGIPPPKIPILYKYLFCYL